MNAGRIKDYAENRCSGNLFYIRAGQSAKFVEDGMITGSGIDLGWGYSIGVNVESSSTWTLFKGYIESFCDHSVC